MSHSCPLLYTKTGGLLSGGCQMRHLTIVVLLAACLPAFGVTAKEGDFPSWWPRIKGDSRSFLPISLICPEDDGGVLELVSHKNAEFGYRLRVVYKNKK